MEVTNVEAKVIDYGLAMSTPQMPDVSYTQAMLSYDFSQLIRWAGAVKDMYSSTEFDLSDPETYKQAKNARAAINGYVKQIDSRRLEVKKAYSKPLDEFENQVKAVTSQLKDASAICDKAVKAMDETWQANRLEELRQEYEDFADLLSPVVPFGKIAEGEKWTNRTADIAKCKKELYAKVERISNDWQTLKSLNLPMYEVAERTFFATLDLKAAIDAERQAEEQQARIEAMKAAMQPAPQPEPEPEPVQEVLALEPETEPIQVHETLNIEINPEHIVAPEPPEVASVKPQPGEFWTEPMPWDRPEPEQPQERKPFVIVAQLTDYELELFKSILEAYQYEIYPGTIQQAFVAASMRRK